MNSISYVLYHKVKLRCDLGLSDCPDVKYFCMSVDVQRVKKVFKDRLFAQWIIQLTNIRNLDLTRLRMKMLI